MAVELANDTNFENEIRENGKVVVKYYAGWCGSCRLFAPKFKRLSADDRFTDVRFLDVDAEESPIAIKKLVENVDLNELKAAEEALLEELQPDFEIEGDDEGEQLTHVFAAIFILEKMETSDVDFKTALREYTQKVRTSIS